MLSMCLKTGTATGRSLMRPQASKLTKRARYKPLQQKNLLTVAACPPDAHRIAPGKQPFEHELSLRIRFRCTAYLVFAADQRNRCLGNRCTPLYLGAADAPPDIAQLN